MPRQQQIDSYHMHEALDRTSNIQCFWDDTVLAHPAIQANKKWLKKAEKISGLMYDLYADIGDKHL